MGLFGLPSELHARVRGMVLDCVTMTGRVVGEVGMVGSYGVYICIIRQSKQVDRSWMRLEVEEAKSTYLQYI